MVSFCITAIVKTKNDVNQGETFTVDLQVFTVYDSHFWRCNYTLLLLWLFGLGCDSLCVTVLIIQGVCEQTATVTIQKTLRKHNTDAKISQIEEKHCFWETKETKGEGEKKRETQREITREIKKDRNRLHKEIVRKILWERERKKWRKRQQSGRNVF